MGLFTEDDRTDKEKLLGLLAEFGIVPEVNKNEPNKFLNHVHSFDLKDGTKLEYAETVIIPPGIGYIDSSCEFYFDEHGKFLKHGCWQ